MSLTTDPNDPKLKEGQKNETGQHEIYLVLSEEERAKGFVRPYRDAYVHVGKKMHYHSIDKVFDSPQKGEYNDKYYVAILNVMGSEGKIIGGSYVTQEELDAWKSGKLIDGCGVETKMNQAISETYARNPKFYGATYCMGCKKHLPVGEFIWSDTEGTTNELVGS